MQMKSMSSRERVRRSLNWQEPDRPPIHLYTTPEAQAKLDRHFAGKDALECLGVDFRTICPQYKGPIRPPQDCITFDEWGTGYQAVDNGSGGTYNEAVIHGLAQPQTLSDVRDYPWPDPADYDVSEIAAFCEAYKDYAIVLGRSGAPDILNGVSRGRGMEQVLIDVATRDPVGLAIIGRRCDILLEMLRRGLEAGRGKVDILYLGEDTANQLGRMFSPKDFDEVFRPRLQRFFDLGHSYGCKVMMHSCGDTHDLQPTFIEMGLDILDSMQPEPPL